MNDLQTEHYHALLVFKTSQVPMHSHIYTNPPICPPLCHLQIASSALPGSYSHMMAWVMQQRRVADHCNAHGEVSNVHSKRDKKVIVSCMTMVQGAFILTCSCSSSPLVQKDSSILPVPSSMVNERCVGASCAEMILPTSVICTTPLELLQSKRHSSTAKHRLRMCAYVVQLLVVYSVLVIRCIEGSLHQRHFCLYFHSPARAECAAAA